MIGTDVFITSIHVRKSNFNRNELLVTIWNYYLYIGHDVVMVQIQLEVRVLENTVVVYMVDCVVYNTVRSGFCRPHRRRALKCSRET